MKRKKRADYTEQFKKDPVDLVISRDTVAVRLVEGMDFEYTGIFQTLDQL